MQLCLRPANGWNGQARRKTPRGQITLTVESEGRLDLHHWMKEPEQAKDGALIFYKRDAMSQLQKAAFTKAYCVHLEEEFDANDAIPMQKHIVISAQTIVIGDMVFENSWGGE